MMVSDAAYRGAPAAALTQKRQGQARENADAVRVRLRNPSMADPSQ